MNRTFGVTCMMLAVLATAATSFGYSFTDVQVEDWAQSSADAAQEAMCVISFPDGADYAFGYRFNAADTATRPASAFANTYGYDAPADKSEAMLLLLDAQTDLDVIYSYHDTLGFGVEGFSYQGHDLLTDGWASSFPGYWVSGMPTYTDFLGTVYPAWDGDGETWQASPSGTSTRMLRDGDWDGFSFELTANGFEPLNPPTTPLAGNGGDGSGADVPEPATLVLVSLGVLEIGRRCRRRRA